MQLLVSTVDWEGWDGASSNLNVIEVMAPKLVVIIVGCAGMARLPYREVALWQFLQLETYDAAINIEALDSFFSLSCLGTSTSRIHDQYIAIGSRD